MPPSWQTKFFFWLIVGLLSTFFAEIPAGSDFFPFFHATGLVITFPIYTLHIVVLASIIYRNYQPTFSSLYIAGMIFGMYEAYITKVLWNPPWGDAFFSAGGVALLETAVLVLFWHPLLAFIIPLVTAETAFTPSRNILNVLPSRFQNRLRKKKQTLVFFLLLIAGFGLYQSTNAPTPLHSIISCPANTAFLLLVSFLWKRYTNGSRYSLQELLPGKPSFFILLILLISMYILLGRTFRYEALPPLQGQISILGLYLLLFVMLMNCLKHPACSAKNKINDTTFPLFGSWQSIFFLSLLFASLSFIGKYFFAAQRGLILLSGWFVFIIIGLILFVGTVIACLVPKRGIKDSSDNA